MIQHPVEVLSGSVVPCMARVSELVSVAMEWARRGNGLGWLTAIHEVHELRFDPAADDLRVFGEALKPLRMFRELALKFSDRQIGLPGFTPAPIPVVLQTWEQHGQDPVHFQVLEVDVAELGQSELPILAFDA